MRPVYECPRCHYRWMPRRNRATGKYSLPKYCSACHKPMPLVNQRDYLRLKAVHRDKRIIDRPQKPLHPVIREAMKRMYLSTD